MSTSEEENKAHYRRTFEEVFNQGNLTLADELVAPDYLNHEVPPDMKSRGPDSTRQIVMMLRTAFPDLRHDRGSGGRSGHRGWPSDRERNPSRSLSGYPADRSFLSASPDAFRVLEATARPSNIVRCETIWACCGNSVSFRCLHRPRRRPLTIPGRNHDPCKNRSQDENHCDRRTILSRGVNMITR